MNDGNDGKSMIEAVLRPLEQVIARVEQKNKRDLICHFSCNGSITDAAKHAKVDRHTHYDWLNNDPVYAEAFQECKRTVGELLESVALERAIQGWEEPAFHQGKECSQKRVSDNVLLAKLLTGFMPEKYAPKGQEINILQQNNNANYKLAASVQ